VLDGLYDLEINALDSQIFSLICKSLTLREFTLLMQSVIALLGLPCPVLGYGHDFQHSIKDYLPNIFK
jgi:hypothetical protein